ncbi:MAG: glycosyltransferase family 1 protein, partial [Tepidisphaeraceae bacterium]
CVKVFLDTDPGYNQMMLQEKFAWSANVSRWCEQVAAHDRHLTYAENIYGSDCRIPRGQFDWRTTRCVVTLPQWERVRNSPPAAHAPFTTVMTWDYFRGKLICDGAEYFTKVPEYERFHDLPTRTHVPLALAVGGDKAPLNRIAADGWSVLSAHEATLTPGSYQQLIHDSAGEWSIAKNVYVATNSGWFSCRTACYLAAGRPAVVQDTGWSRFIPSGHGVFAFSTTAEAIASLYQAAADPAAQRDAAYAIAREYLAPDKVLPPMIDAIFR